MKLGYLSAIAYVIFTVMGTLFVEQRFYLLGNASSSVFLAMIIASIFFTLIGYKSAKRSYVNIIAEKKSYFMMSASVGIAWILIVIGVKYANSLVFNMFIFLSAAIISYILSYFASSKKIYLFISACAVALLLTTIVLDFSLIVGIMIGLVAGVFSFLYRKISSEYSKRTNSNALSILMTRFWSIIIIPAFVVNYQDVLNIIVHHYLMIVVFSMSTLVIPNFFSQYSINILGAEQTSMIDAFIFPLIWLGEFIEKNPITSSMSALVLSLCATVIISSPYVFRRYFR